MMNELLNNWDMDKLASLLQEEDLAFFNADGCYTFVDQFTGIRFYELVEGEKEWKLYTLDQEENTTFIGKYDRFRDALIAIQQVRDRIRESA